MSVDIDAQDQGIDAESIRFFKGLLYVALFVTTPFFIAYVATDSHILAMIVGGLWIAYAVSLWLVHHGKYVHGVLQLATVVSITGILTSTYLNPVNAYWLSIVAVAAFVLMQKKASVWVVALFLGTCFILITGTMGRHPLYTTSEAMNIIFGYLTVVVLCYMFLIRVESKQKQIAEYSGQLAVEQAEREKLELARTLAGGIAHLINNEMQTIVAKSFVLKRKLPADSATEIDALTQIAMQASAHTHQLLSYAEGSRSLRRKIDMHTLLQEVAEVWRGRIPDHILLYADLGEYHPVCDGDEKELKQLLGGLLENAVEACDQDGVITLGMEEACIERDENNGLKRGDYVKITVGDNGHGMSRQVMAHIFEPFYSTRFAGRGLGLSAIFGIVAHHRGKIAVESEEKQGSLFTVWWPVSGAPEKM